MRPSPMLGILKSYPMQGKSLAFRVAEPVLTQGRLHQVGCLHHRTLSVPKWRNLPRYAVRHEALQVGLEVR